MKPVPENERCQERMSDGWYPVRQCSRRATVERGGPRDGVRYCSQHDPDRVQARRDTTHARWRAERDALSKLRDRQRLEHEALLGIPDDVLASGLIQRLYQEHQRLMALKQEQASVL